MMAKRKFKRDCMTCGNTNCDWKDIEYDNDSRTIGLVGRFTPCDDFVPIRGMKYE